VTTVLDELRALATRFFPAELCPSVRRAGGDDYVVRLERGGEWIETVLEIDSLEALRSHGEELARELRRIEFHLVNRTENRRQRRARRSMVRHEVCTCWSKEPIAVPPALARQIRASCPVHGGGPVPDFPNDIVGRS